MSRIGRMRFLKYVYSKKSVCGSPVCVTGAGIILHCKTSVLIVLSTS